MQSLLFNLGINWKLFFAQTVNFLLVLWLLQHFVFKKLLAFLEARKQRIEKGVELTQRAEREMARIDEARKHEIDQAKQQGEKLLAEAKTLAQQKVTAMLLLAKSQEEKLLAAGKMQAAKEKEETMRKAKSEIRESALALAEKVLEREISEKDEERLEKELFEQFNSQFYAK